MNETEKLRDQIAKIAYRYIPSLSKANTLLGMVDKYAQQVSRKAAIDFKLFEEHEMPFRDYWEDEFDKWQK